MAVTDIGKLGVWTWLDAMSYGDAGDFAAEIEQLGYSALWIPEAVGRDPFVLLAVLAGKTQSLYLATGIANIYARDAMAMNAARRSMDELTGGRLVLGLGVSHTEMVSTMRQHEYGKPVATMRNYLQAMENAFYAGPQPEKSGPVLLGALRDKMIGLSGDSADGAHPYFVTPEHTARARAVLGPDKLLAPEQKVLLISDATEARAVARQAMAGYLGLQNYCNNLKTLGFTDEDLENGGSDRLVDAIVAWGDENTIAKRIEAHWEAGADHVCIQALRPDGEMGADMDALRALADLAK
jgi:probable F420-dependent oxidoreductase